MKQHWRDLAQKFQVIPINVNVNGTNKNYAKIMFFCPTDLWLDYIKLELNDGDPNVVSKLHWRAMKSLSGDSVEEFVTKYALLQQFA